MILIHSLDPRATKASETHNLRLPWRTVASPFIRADSNLAAGGYRRKQYGKHFYLWTTPLTDCLAFVQSTRQELWGAWFTQDSNQYSLHANLYKVDALCMYLLPRCCWSSSTSTFPGAYMHFSCITSCMF